MKYPLLLTLSLCFCGLIQAQPKPTVEFEFKLPEARKKDSTQQLPKVSNSYYNRIEFVDSRPWPVIGPTSKGLLRGTPADLVLKQPVGDQLSTILAALLDSTAGSGELLFQLRNFRYIEDEPTAYCFLLATLYTKSAGGYQKLLTIDTVFVNRGPHVPGPLNAYATQAIIDFIGSALTLHPGDSTAYDLYAVKNMDSIDRHHLPLFTDTHGWMESITRTDNELLFTGDVRVPPTDADFYRAYKVLDYPGVLMASKGWRTTYLMAIDPVGGLFLHLRRIPKQPATN